MSRGDLKGQRGVFEKRGKATAAAISDELKQSLPFVLGRPSPA